MYTINTQNMHVNNIYIFCINKYTQYIYIYYIKVDVLNNIYLSIYHLPITSCTLLLLMIKDGSVIRLLLLLGGGGGILLK